jgi:hypothetical protein
VGRRRQSGGTGASRLRRKQWGLLRSWGTSVRSPPSQTPVGPLRLAFEDDLRCGELPFAGGFRHHAGASFLTFARFSLRLAVPRFRRRSLHSDGYPRQSLFRSSITRLSHSLSTLRSFPSRSRGRTATQDSLPAGGQPLPDGGHDPARSQMKFQPRLHGFLLIQASQRKQRPSSAALLQSAITVP